MAALPSPTKSPPSSGAVLAAEHDFVLTGYMRKRNTKTSSKLLRNWDKRWFALDNTAFLYATSPQAREPRQAFPLQEILQVRLIDEEDINPGRRQRDHFEFEVWLPSRTLRLRPKSESQRRHWVAALQRARALISSTPEAPPTPPYYVKGQETGASLRGGSFGVSSVSAQSHPVEDSAWSQYLTQSMPPERSGSVALLKAPSTSLGVEAFRAECERRFPPQSQNAQTSKQPPETPPCISSQPSYHVRSHPNTSVLSHCLANNLTPSPVQVAVEAPPTRQLLKKQARVWVPEESDIRSISPLSAQVTNQHPAHQPSQSPGVHRPPGSHANPPSKKNVSEAMKRVRSPYKPKQFNGGGEKINGMKVGGATLDTWNERDEGQLSGSWNTEDFRDVAKLWRDKGDKSSWMKNLSGVDAREKETDSPSPFEVQQEASTQPSTSPSENIPVPRTKESGIKILAEVDNEVSQWSDWDSDKENGRHREGSAHESDESVLTEPDPGSPDREVSARITRGTPMKVRVNCLYEAEEGKDPVDGSPNMSPIYKPLIVLPDKNWLDDNWDSD